MLDVVSPLDITNHLVAKGRKEGRKEGREEGRKEKQQGENDKE
jgi:hypothetical protein